MSVDYPQCNYGVRAVVRECRPEDIPQIIEGLDSLSYESRIARFFYDKHSFSAKELERLAQPSDEKCVILVALVPDESVGERVVGLARCVRVAEQSPLAEVDAVILDGYRRAGIGAQLVAGLRDAALRIGVTRWRADYFAAELGAEKLLHRVGREEKREILEPGIVRVTVELQREPPAA